MNVLKPNLKSTVETLLGRGISHRELHRKTGIDRKTIRKYDRLYHLSELKGDDPSNASLSEEVATGFWVEPGENPPPRPPALEKAPKQARSACELHRDWIEKQLELGRNAMAIYQDLVEQFGFTHRYNSVKRFVRGLRKNDPKQYDRLEYLPGEESQLDYGQGAPTRCENGTYRRPRLFVMVFVTDVNYFSRLTTIKIPGLPLSRKSVSFGGR